jgi:hypothetical protein
MNITTSMLNTHIKKMRYSTSVTKGLMPFDGGNLVLDFSMTVTYLGPGVCGILVVPRHASCTNC